MVGVRVFIRAFYGSRNVSRPHEQRNAQVDDGRQGKDPKQTGNLKIMLIHMESLLFFMSLEANAEVTRLIYFSLSILLGF